MKPQLVIDTNVWVAAFRSRTGASRRVIDRVLEGEFDFHLTVPLLMEYEEIFVRERRAMGLTEEEVENLLVFITAVVFGIRCISCGDGRCRTRTMRMCWKQRSRRTAPIW